MATKLGTKLLDLRDALTDLSAMADWVVKGDVAHCRFEDAARECLDGEVAVKMTAVREAATAVREALDEVMAPQEIGESAFPVKGGR